MAKKTSRKTTKKAAVRKPQPTARTAPRADRAGARADFGAAIESAIAQEAGETKRTMQTLHKMILASDPAIRGCIKWGNPTYELNGMLFALATTSKGVNMMFMNGTSLKDPKGLLDGTGKSCRHVKVPSLDAVDVKAVGALMKQAVGLAKKG